jgi:hypothetical protein
MTSHIGKNLSLKTGWIKGGQASTRKVAASPVAKLTVTCRTASVAITFIMALLARPFNGACSCMSLATPNQEFSG